MASIFSTDDDDLVLTRVRHSCFSTSLQGEIQYSFDRQAVLDKSKKTLWILKCLNYFFSEGIPNDDLIQSVYTVTRNITMPLIHNIHSQIGSENK